MTDECIEWQRARGSHGYGQMWYKGRVMLAHRVAYMMASGQAASDIAGLDIRHTCDNRGCVNPKHLIPGSRLDNMRDMVDRGRSLRGDKHYLCKLDDQAVAAIRAAYVPRHREFGGAALARRYGVDQSTISQITSGKRRNFT